MNNKQFKLGFIAVVLGFLVSAAVIALLAEGGFIESFVQFFVTYFETIIKYPADIINKTAFYIILGIAVATGFKAGVFNIGAAGQMFAGQYFAVVTVAWLGQMGIDGAPAWMLGLVIGTLAGALVGLIPALMKAYLGLHEVVTTIMFNYISIFVIDFLISNPNSPTAFASRSQMETINVKEIGSSIPMIGDVSLIIFIAVGVFFAFDYVMKHTTLGLEIRSVGYNKEAAKNAGINVNTKMLQVFLISAALAGLAGACWVLGVDYSVATTSTPPADGFNGINIAIVGANTGIGVALISTLFASLAIAAFPMQSALSVSMKTTQLTTALILLFACAQYGIEKYLDKRSANASADKSKKAEQETAKLEKKKDKGGKK